MFDYNHDKPLTYRQLQAALNELTEEQLDMFVLIMNSGDLEVHPVFETYIVSELPEAVLGRVENVLELQQPVIVM